MTSASPNPAPRQSDVSADAAAVRLAGETLLERIGNTPLLRFDTLTRDLPAVQLLGKAEWYNPGGSVKDRTAASIVADARRSGKLAPGKILLDSTSGNTGIAYAMIAAADGFPVTLCMPSNVSVERKRILHAYGANIIYTDPGDGSDGAIRAARELYAKHPDKYFYADQYSNDANWQAHYHGTANEIWQQTEGHVTHFVSMMGTSGTFMGTTRRLKELNPQIRCISLQPDSPFHGIEGAKHMASAMVPKIYNASLADQDIGRSCIRRASPERIYNKARHHSGSSTASAFFDSKKPQKLYTPLSCAQLCETIFICTAPNGLRSPPALPKLSRFGLLWQHFISPSPFLRPIWVRT